MSESCIDCNNCEWVAADDGFTPVEFWECQIYDDHKVPHSKVPAKCRRRGDFIKREKLVIS